MRIAVLLSLAVLPALAVAPPAPQDAPLRMNQIQVIGTHNSYHAGISSNERKVWEAKYADALRALDYRHVPLPQQFDAGVRQIELDIYADTKGGRYAHPAGPGMAKAAGLPADPDFDPNGTMTKPGFKVMHIQDVDYRSTCQPFTECLRQVRTWSLAHPEHVPIYILVETKEGSPKNLKLTEPEPFTAPVFDALDAEIRSVFPSSEMVTPDDVRGQYPTLNAAALANAWPTLQSARGKVVFLLDQQHVTPIYTAGHPSLQGRVLFTNSTVGAPDAAFLERNEGPADDISALVRQGYLIRARTDADTKQARSDDTTLRDAMLASGAQILSTDYPVNEPATYPGHFVVTLPGGATARCNPVNTSASCPGELVKQVVK